jgi:hypothetical protein
VRKREREREKMPMQAQTLRLYPEAYIEGMWGNMSCCLGYVTEVIVALLYWRTWLLSSSNDGCLIRKASNVEL